MTKDEQVLHDDFLRLALKRSEALSSNDSKEANKLYDRLHQLKAKMRSLPDRGDTVLKAISSSPNPHVRVSAATCLLGVDEPFALRVLKEVAEQNLGLVSFSAEMTMKEWNAGGLREYWG